MIRKSLIKEVIVSNREFIVSQVKDIVSREGVHFPLSPASINKTVVFYGVRRSGKTFILFDLFKKHKDNALYIDFEDERLEDFQLKDFETLRDAMLELNPHLIGKELVFLFDEVQNITGWERFCRRAVERENIKVFVSGSSSRMMPFEIHTELRGRSWSIETLPFSFREYLNTRNINNEDKGLVYGPQKPALKKHFLEYMRWGGFPEMSFLKSDLERNKLIKEYLGAMYFRDLVERYNITNIALLEGLMDKLFSSFSQKFSLTAFYKQYKDKYPFSKDLLFKYYKHFVQSMLIFEVRKFSESTYKRMRNPAKVYLVDTGLSRRVTSADAGKQLENIVFLELHRKGYEIFYFEEKKECDFITKADNGTLLPIQICLELNEENIGREIDGLVCACKWTNTNNGMILTLDEEKDLIAEGITIKVYPVWKWCIEGNIVK